MLNRIISIIVIGAIIAIPASSYTLKVKDIKNCMVHWHGLYTPYLIQINTCYVHGLEERKIVMKHEMTHHNCFLKFKNLDPTHKKCAPYV